MPLLTNIPKYHSKDLFVLLFSMLPMAVLLNYLLFGNELFHPWTFIGTNLWAFIYLGIAFITYGIVAIALRDRYPSDSDLLKRLLICLGIFYIMSAAFISLLLFIFDLTGFYGYKYRESHFTTAYLCFIVINTFLTFLNEGLYRFEKMKANLVETEQLKKEYMHSQLLGLKSQTDPHFLFNGLNTLSSLIQEDQEKAEEFLDHMSKVYRYLLRSKEETLVTIGTELSFIRSYHFLLQQRFGEGLQLEVEVPQSSYEQMIPPLTLQMLLENCVNNNTVSKTRPLNVMITQIHDKLVIKNTLAPKLKAVNDQYAAIDNIANKYRLLCKQEICIDQTNNDRTITLPIIANELMIA